MATRTVATCALLLTAAACSAPSNACGGTALLEAAPGEGCGMCGQWACSGQDSLRCEETPQNECGGCADLGASAGDRCGACGSLRCAGPDELSCTDDHPVNACGGCEALDASPADACGACGLRVCSSLDTLGCDDPGPNSCGGCASLSAEPGGACGPCMQDRYACVGSDAVECDGATLCPDGFECTDASECAGGSCSFGHCAPIGWVYVPSGTFVMGAPTSERGFHPGRENGQHTVVLTRSLLVAETSTTQAQWLAVMGTRPFYFSSCGDDCPAESVNWWEMLAYANELSRAEGREACYSLLGCTGVVGEGCRGAVNCNGVTCAAEPTIDLDCLGYRLPTESEWEYFARAGTNTAFLTASGSLTNWAPAVLDAELDAVAWYAGNSGVTYPGGIDCTGVYPGATFCGPHPVRSKAPNSWGLFDLTGNVWERTGDWLATYPDPGSTVTDPTGPETGTQRAMRGGPFDGFGQYMRVAYRSGPLAHARYYNIGFRLVRTLPPAAGP